MEAKMKKLLLIVLILSASFAADSLNVRLLGRYTPCSPLDIVVDGSTAYVANSSGGLMVLDVANPAAISSPGYVFLPGEATSIARIGDNVAIACSDSTIRILDPSNPADISIVGEFSSSKVIVKCFVSGDTIFSTGGSFSVFSGENPSSITRFGEFTPVFGAEGIFVKTPYAFLAEGNYGLSIIDISNPHSLSSFGRFFGLEENVRSIFVDRWNRLYIGTAGELLVYRIEGVDLTLLGRWTAPSAVRDIEVDGNYAFLACGNSGLRVLDVQNPSAITEVGYYVLGSEMTAIHLDYPRVWLVGLWARVNCFDISPFANIEEDIAKPEKGFLRIFPSPFNAECTIDGPICRAALFDIHGNKVDEIEIPGQWRPRVNILSGIYFLRAIDSESIPTARVLLMR
jgi:hypothetical protein